MRFLYYLPAGMWAVIVLYVGSRQFSDVPSYDLPVDKLAHFVLYGVLGALAAAGWRGAGRRPAVLVPLLAALLVGTLDELQQRRIATRTADWADWGVDVIAVGLAFGIVAAAGRQPAEGRR